MYNYDRNIIVVAYRAANPDDLDPKEKTLTDFDADLFAIYDQEIRKQVEQLEILVNVFTRSMLAFFAARATVKALKRRVAHACAYFDSVRPQPSVVVASSEPGVPSAADE